MTQVSIWSIIGKIAAPKQISIMVIDIKFIARSIKNIALSYCNRNATTLTERIARKAHTCPCGKMQYFQLYVVISLFFKRKKKKDQFFVTSFILVFPFLLRSTKHLFSLLLSFSLPCIFTCSSSLISTKIQIVNLKV